MQNISHRGILRYHAGALWLETLRTGNEKGIKKPTLMEEGGLTPRELDDIAADIAAANNLLKDRYESIHFFTPCDLPFSSCYNIITCTFL